jgi:thiamine biosynthesis lipoprotein
MLTRVARPAMGCLFEIYLHGDDPERLQGVAEEALAAVERLDRQLSHYRDDSDTARINALAGSEWVRVEPGLYRLLERCNFLSHVTQGAFDITTGALEKGWGFYRGEGHIPSDDEISTLLSQTSIKQLRFDPGPSAVRLETPGTELTFGAIGKGYALDAAAAVLRFYDVESAVLNAGQSTIYAMGAPPGAEGWEFTLRDPCDRETPLKTMLLRDQAISTSGDYEQFFEADGVRYSHVIDPRTGRPISGMYSVWVITSPYHYIRAGIYSAWAITSPYHHIRAGLNAAHSGEPFVTQCVEQASAADGDALSTAFFVLGPEKTRELCRRFPLRGPGPEVVMVHASADGEGVEVSHILPGRDPEEMVAVAHTGHENAETFCRALWEANMYAGRQGSSGSYFVLVREQDRERAVAILKKVAAEHRIRAILLP